MMDRRRQETRRILVIVLALAATCFVSLFIASEWVVASQNARRTDGNASTAAQSKGSPTTSSEGSLGTSPTTSPDPTATQLPTPSATSTPNAPQDNRFAVLLLGYGGGNHDGTFLTDAMMVVVVDPDNKSIGLLSIPRDAWVPLDFNGGSPIYNKINTAYAFARDSHLYTDRLVKYDGEEGAGVFAKDTVANILGIPVDHYFAIDFQGFRDAIDTLGGIDVVIPNSFTARYPANDNPNIDPSWKIVRFTAGPEHMSGERALQFTRAREVLDNPVEGTDFARSARQRIVLAALKEKLFQPASLIRLPQLLNIAQRASDTDYPLPAVTDVATLAASWSDVRFYQASLSSANLLEEGTGSSGAYLLVPRAEGASWSNIRAFARRLWAEPALGEQMSTTQIAVSNRSSYSGLAGDVSDRLASLGYLVTEPQSGAIQTKTIIRDESDGKAVDLIQAIEKDLGLDSVEVVESKRVGAAKVVIEVGEDAVDEVMTMPIAADPGAPRSAVGVQVFGRWVPVAPAPTMTPIPRPTATRDAKTPSSQPVRPEQAGSPTVSPAATPSTPAPNVTPAPTKPQTVPTAAPTAGQG